jgi:uncharacterized protein (DUF433 family)
LRVEFTDAAGEQVRAAARWWRENRAAAPALFESELAAVIALHEAGPRACYSDLVTAFDRITSDPARMNGQPCVRSLRLTVRRVLEAMATYPDRAELLREYPELEDEDLRQVLGYAASSLDDKVLEIPKSA